MVITRSARNSESPQSSRYRRREEGKAAKRLAKVPLSCALKVVKETRCDDGSVSQSSVLLCKRPVAQQVRVGTPKWTKFCQNFEHLREELEGVVDNVVVPPLVSGVSFCSTCYSRILQLLNTNEDTMRRSNMFINNIKKRIRSQLNPEPEKLCSVHGRLLLECDPNHGGKPMKMMKQNNDSAIAEQRCFIRSLFGVNVCGDTLKLFSETIYYIMKFCISQVDRDDFL